MRNISERRRMKGSGVFDGNEQFQMKKVKQRVGDLSVENYQKTIKDLRLIAQQQRQRRLEVQQQMVILRKRTLGREKQFYRVLEKTHSQVKKYTQPDINPESTADLEKLYHQIFENFEYANLATNKFIQNHYQDNKNMMERRIAEIMETFKAQIQKNKKLSDESYRNIREDVEDILVLAKSIEQQNKSIKTKLKQEEFKNKLLNEEKKLLLDEVLEKKRIILKLHSQVKTYQENPEKDRKFKSQNEDTSPLIMPKFMGEPTIEGFQSSQNKSLNLTQKLRVKQKQTKNSRITSFLSHSSYQKTALNSTTKPSIDQNQRVINHLKICLDREKKKVRELSNIVTQVQNKNNQINAAIISSFQASKSDSERLTDLLKSQKLFQTIKDLKKRLAMCEAPTVGTGWGQIQIHEILPQNIPSIQ